MPLFVGGVADGEFHNPAPEYETWTVRERPKLTEVKFPLETSPTMSRLSHYRRMKWNAGKETYTIWAEVRMTPDKVMERLIEYYTPTVTVHQEKP
jgi:hypothetical protein